MYKPLARILLKKMLFTGLFGLILLPPISCFSQDIRFVDTTIEEGYFYCVRYAHPDTLASCAVGKGKLCYYLNPGQYGIRVDSNYFRQQHRFDDTVTHLSFTPDILDNEFLRGRKVDDGLLSLYRKCINVTDSVNPQKYYEISSSRNPRIGLAYVKIKWLHLKIIDRLACCWFNTPYALADPRRVPRFYDVFLPMQLIRIDNNIKVRDEQIVLK